MPPTPEGEVLKPIDPSCHDSNEWAIFVLDNAHVVHESNGKPTSLLTAYADTPLKVVGTYTPSRGQSKYLLNKLSKPIELEVRGVARYSYAELTDGDIAIWAQGKAGWFEIRSAPHYSETYEGMVEAVQLLYFVTDLYSGPRKRGGGPSPQLVFQEYAEDERFTCTDPVVAGEIFKRHHVFLIMCFLTRTHGISWSNTPLYQYFRRQHPKDFDACKARIEGRYTHVLPERQARPTKSSTPSAPPAAPVATNTKSVRGKTAIPKTDQVPKKDNNWWEAATLFEFMQKVVNQRVLRPGRNQITLERVAQLVVRRYEIEELETAQNVLLVHASNLCYMMDHPRRKNVRFFAEEPIYRELAAGHNLPAAEQRRVEGVELKPRRDHATLKDEEVESSDTLSEEEVIRTPVRRPPGRRRRGRLSVLRPTSSKFSGKSKSINRTEGSAGKGKAPVRAADLSDNSETQGDPETADSDDDDEDEDDEDDDDMEIDTPTQALSPGREKRKLEETDADEQEEKTRRKRTGASITPESPPTSEDDDTEVALANGAVPLRYRPTTNGSSSRPESSHTKARLAPSLISTPLPTYEPNGPRDSWICNFDGCTQRIYGCSKEIGRRLITEHLEDHAKGREKVVGILWREQDKLHLPVNNLIKKIREMSEAKTSLFPSTTAENVQPQPIQRPV